MGVGRSDSATQIGLLTEMYWGLGMRTYSRSRGWTEAQFDAAEADLRARGLLDGDGFSDAGRALRESIEVATDDQMTPALDALGDDVFELFEIMEPWGAAVRGGLGYLSDGPHDLAETLIHHRDDLDSANLVHRCQAPMHQVGRGSRRSCACTDLAAMVAWFTTEVGLRIETISPADDPATYVLTGHGITVRVVRGDQRRADHARRAGAAARGRGAP